VITFYNELPVSVELNGRHYALTPTHQNVLRMYDATKGMDYEAQVDIMLHYLVKGKYPLSTELLEAIQKVLFPNVKQNNKKVFDFVQDSELIYAAFMQVYRIDLIDTPLHWWKFQALMSGLPSNTRFSEVVQIRAMDIPKPNKYNAEERGRIIRLKHEYALKVSAEEREQNLQDGLKKMLAVLLARAEKNG
jgi:hypothetical protein